jgi:hypothetical protein
MNKYLELAKKARRETTTSTKQTRAADTKHEQSTDPGYDINDRNDITRSPGVARPKRPKRQKPLEGHGQLAVEQVLEELERPMSGPGLQARLYRAGRSQRRTP